MTRGIFVTLVLLIAMPAMAGDADNASLCTNAGKMASEIAEARDVGVPIKALRHKAELAELQNSATPEQQLALQHLIGAIYSDPDITPEIAAQGALEGCLQRIHQAKPPSH